MEFYDCFYGIGGSRLGFERAGHKCVGGCEKGKWQRKIYANRFGEERTQEDIEKVKRWDELPDFDFLAAGLPCQPFSCANRTTARGFRRKDAQLFFSVLRLIKYKRPAFLLFENVAGLLSDSQGQSFATWLLHLEKMGYDAEWAYFNGSSFGMRCGHEHIFLIGWDAKRVCPERVLPKRQHLAISSFQAHAAKFQVIQRITTKERSGFDNSSVILDQYGLRTLLPEEIERLLGFPEGWTMPAPKTVRHAMLGNVWPPVMAEFLGRYVLPNETIRRKA